MLQVKLIHYICSFLLILPIISQSNEVVLLKTSKSFKDSDRISYSLELKKLSMNVFKGNPIIRDRFSKKTQLDSVNNTPSAYYIDSQRLSGYPLPKDFPAVRELEWELQSSQRFRYPQDHFTASPEGGTNFRNDLLHFPETTLAWEKDYTYGVLPPLVDIVKGKQWVFSASMDGRLTAFQSNTGKKIWEFMFPLGETIQNAMASYIHQDRLFISAGTNLGNIYFFLGETGSVIQKIHVGSPLNAPLHYFKFEEMTGLIAVSRKELICIDIETGKESWRKVTSEEINLSPFTLQVGHQVLLILGSNSGNIQALSLEGSTVWQKTGDLSVLISLLGFVSRARPYIAGVSGSKNVFLLNAENGEVLSRKKIPAFPRSRLSVDAPTLSYALLVSDVENSDQSLLISDHFLSDQRVAGRVSLPGKRFLGPIGTRMDGEIFYYLIDEQWQLWMVQKGSQRPVRGFPFKLTLLPGADYPHQMGGMVLTEYALFAACPGKGLMAVGIPETEIKDRSFKELSSHRYSQSNYRNDLDALPPVEKTHLYPMGFSLPDKQRILPKPSVLLIPKSRDFFIISSTREGNLILYDDQGSQQYRLNLNGGKLNISPIFEVINENEIKVYVLSKNVLKACLWNLTTQRLVQLWERRDFGSKGSSFVQIEHESGKFLYFVDERNFLTAVNCDSGDTLFRETVDSHQFAYHVIYTQSFIFCGSRKIDAKSGKLIARSFVPGSHSSIISFAGKSYLFQSDDLDMIAFDAYKHEVIWKVRKLWCRRYCFQHSAPALLNKAYGSWAFWTDYNRLVCIDVLTGFISWRSSVTDDYLLSTPSIAENANTAIVYLGSIKGRLYAFHARSGANLESYPIQLPGKENPDEILKGCSTPLVINGCLLVYRLETGLIQFGKAIENNRDFGLIQFQVKNDQYKFGKAIFNRAEVFWHQKTFFSNIVQD